MDARQIKTVKQFAAAHIGKFHGDRLSGMKELKLKHVLERCNPYLLKAKNLESADAFVRSVFGIYLARSEQTSFGRFLEKVAVRVVEILYGGHKSGTDGLDLEFSRDNVYYLVSVKSSPNWGNSTAVKSQVVLFNKAATVIRQGDINRHVVGVVGCCTGRRDDPDRGKYYQYCGQDFWKFLSGNDTLYLEIIEPLGRQAMERNQEFAKEYDRFLNLAVGEFMRDYCIDGAIDWEKLVKLNSERRQKAAPRKAKKR